MIKMSRIFIIILEENKMYNKKDIVPVLSCYSNKKNLKMVRYSVRKITISLTASQPGIVAPLFLTETAQLL